MSDNKNEKGVWRTIRGRKVFIKDGQSLDEALEESGMKDEKPVKEDKPVKEEKKEKVDLGPREEFDLTTDDDFGFDEEDHEDNLDDYLEYEGIYGYANELREVWRDKEAYIDGELESFETPEDAVRAYLSWEGIYGYDSRIIDYLRDEDEFDEYSRNYTPNQDTIPNHLRDADYQEGHDYEADNKDEEDVEEWNKRAFETKDYSEGKKYNIGSDKQLSGDDLQKMRDLADAFKEAGLNVDVKNGYEDYGADMKWTSLSYDGTWVLSPKDWLDYMNGNKTAEEMVDYIKSDDFWRKKFVESRKNDDQTLKGPHPDMKIMKGQSHGTLDIRKNDDGSITLNGSDGDIDQFMEFYNKYREKLNKK